MQMVLNRIFHSQKIILQKTATQDNTEIAHVDISTIIPMEYFYPETEKLPITIKMYLFDGVDMIC